jgi:tRNA pseudouridine55 synthase
MYSALKRDGVPLYALARKGVSVDRPARDVTVHALELRLAEPSALDFVVRCSKGTYVRVLAADIGRALGTVAHLETLRRLQVGAFGVADARTPEALRASDASAWPLVSIGRALAGLRRIAMEPPDLAALRHGRQACLRACEAGQPGEPALVVDATGGVAAVVEMADAGWRLVRLLGDA